MSYWSSWPNICHWSLLSFWTGKRWKGSSAWNLSILVPQQKTPYEGSWWNFLWFHYFWIFAIQLLKKHYPFHSTESYHNLATRNNQLGELLSGHIHCQPMLSVQTCTVKKNIYPLSTFGWKTFGLSVSVNFFAVLKRVHMVFDACRNHICRSEMLWIIRFCIVFVDNCFHCPQFWQHNSIIPNLESANLEYSSNKMTQ